MSESTLKQAKVRLPDHIYELVLRKAEENMRSVSSEIAFAAIKYYEMTGESTPPPRDAIAKKGRPRKLMAAAAIGLMSLAAPISANAENAHRTSTVYSVDPWRRKRESGDSVERDTIAA